MSAARSKWAATPPVVSPAWTGAECVIGELVAEVRALRREVAELRGDRPGLQLVGWDDLGPAIDVDDLEPVLDGLDLLDDPAYRDYYPTAAELWQAAQAMGAAKVKRHKNHHAGMGDPPYRYTLAWRGETHAVMADESGPYIEVTPEEPDEDEEPGEEYEIAAAVACRGLSLEQVQALGAGGVLDLAKELHGLLDAIYVGEGIRLETDANLLAIAKLRPGGIAIRNRAVVSARAVLATLGMRA